MRSRDKDMEVGRHKQNGVIAITRRRDDGSYYVATYPVQGSIVPAIDDDFAALLADMAKLYTILGENNANHI